MVELFWGRDLVMEWFWQCHVYAGWCTYVFQWWDKGQIFVFKLSTEEQEGFKSCVVMVQALEKALCNHHLTVEILSATAALLHGAYSHHSLPKLCYPQARAQLWILVGWLKHVASPHKTRVCDFIFLPSSEQLLNNSLGEKKKVHAFHIDTWEQCCAALVSPGSCRPALLPVWNKLVIESRPL